MTRYFTLQEARQLLPEIEAAIREAMGLKAEYQRAEAELRAGIERIAMLGGVDLDRVAFLERRSRREAIATRLKELIDGIQGLGCLVKDLDIGLIDFPSLYRGEEVYLCWKLGEDGIAFWHGVEEGYSGRKPIDREFLDNHRGGGREPRN